MNARFPLPLWMATALCVANTASAVEQNSPPEPAFCIKTQVAGAQAQGWRLRGIDTVTIPAQKGNGKEVDYRLTLYKGSRYLFLACADSALTGLRLEALDQQGAVFTGEQSQSKAPLLSISPARTGSYALRLIQTAGLDNQVVSLAVLYR